MLTLEPVQVPLVMTNGELRVVGSRIGLQHIVCEYQQGADAEDIAMRFPSLKLADVHAILWYYLTHQAEVETYILEREEQADELRGKLEIQFPIIGLRQRLLEKAALKSS